MQSMLEEGREGSVSQVPPRVVLLEAVPKSGAGSRAVRVSVTSGRAARAARRRRAGDLADRSLVNELYSLAARLSLTDLTVRRDPTPPARAHVINARYTPIAKSAPPTAPMTYRCAGGLGAPAQSSYAMTPLEPARTRRREEEGGALVQRREGRRGRRMEGERARRDATRDGGLERRFDSIPRARAHRRTRTRR